MSQNIDPHEIKKFDAMASQWWDPNGPCKPLHQLNPLRVAYIEKHTTIAGKKILDVGCGGGILSEALAIKGADVTAIDMSKQAIDVAKLHALDVGLSIDYHRITAEVFAETANSLFDIVTCMELLEHVPNPQSLIHALAKCLKPGGQLFLSTLNRTPKSYLFAIVGAEYILKLLPRGTHDYAKFITPGELATWLRQAGFSLTDLQGLRYHPWRKTFSYASDVNINYLACARL